MGQHDAPAAVLDERLLARAVDENVYALFRSMQLLDGAAVEDFGHIGRHHAWPTNPMFAGAWGSGAATAAVEEIVAVEEWLRTRGAPFGFWWACGASADVSVGNALVDRGWAPFDLGAPGMVADLDHLDRSVVERVPDDFEIRQAATRPELEDFASVFVASFGVPAFAAQAWVDATDALGSRAPWQILIGRCDGVPVAATIAFGGGGVASVFGVGVVPERRGQGLGAAITLAGYDLLQERGYRYGVLFATPEGEPVYAKLGFRHTGRGVSRWLWRAEA
jgi:ribosomal protein S18 acetylase RimI-like enzyme